MEYTKFEDNIKKLDCTITKLDISFNLLDTRCWCALINQNTDNIIVTHHLNKHEYGTSLFDVFSTNKIITDIENEYIYDTVELLLNKKESLTEQPEQTE